jgi:hypothetical protein
MAIATMMTHPLYVGAVAGFFYRGWLWRRRRHIGYRQCRRQYQQSAEPDGREQALLHRFSP